MNQTTASSMVKLYGTFKNIRTGRIEGRGIYKTEPDAEYRQRLRIFLTARGDQIFNNFIINLRCHKIIDSDNY